MFITLSDISHPLLPPIQILLEFNLFGQLTRFWSSDVLVQWSHRSGNHQFFNSVISRAYHANIISYGDSSADLHVSKLPKVHFDPLQYQVDWRLSLHLSDYSLCGKVLIREVIRLNDLISELYNTVLTFIFITYQTCQSVIESQVFRGSHHFLSVLSVLSVSFPDALSLESLMFLACFLPVIPLFSWSLNEQLPLKTIKNMRIVRKHWDFHWFSAKLLWEPRRVLRFSGISVFRNHQSFARWAQKKNLKNLKKIF